MMEQHSNRILCTYVVAAKRRTFSAVCCVYKLYIDFKFLSVQGYCSIYVCVYVPSRLKCVTTFLAILIGTKLAMRMRICECDVIMKFYDDLIICDLYFSWSNEYTLYCILFALCHTICCGKKYPYLSIFNWSIGNS